MDDEAKKAELSAADSRVAEAQGGLDGANKALKDAQGAQDGSAMKEAEGKVKGATEALDAAKAAKAEVEGRHAADTDAGDILSDLERGGKLADGTDPKKPIPVPKDKFDDLNEKAKLFDQFSPLLAKLQKQPELIDRLMAGDDPNQSVNARIKALEQREDAQRKVQVRDVIQAAVATWPDFRARWEDIKPILSGLEATGIPYADAVQRAYFAVHPEAASGDKRLVARERALENERQRGQSGGFGGGGPVVHRPNDGEYPLTDADREFAQKSGVDPKLYSKHADWIKRFADL